MFHAFLFACNQYVIRYCCNEIKYCKQRFLSIKMVPTEPSYGRAVEYNVFRLIHHSSVGLSAGDFGCLRPWVQIPHSAEEDNSSPFDSKIVCMCPINNNKYENGANWAFGARKRPKNWVGKVEAKWNMGAKWNTGCFGKNMLGMGLLLCMCQSIYSFCCVCAILHPPTLYVSNTERQKVKD